MPGLLSIFIANTVITPQKLSIASDQDALKQPEHDAPSLPKTPENEDTRETNTPEKREIDTQESSSNKSL